MNLTRERHDKFNKMQFFICLIVLAVWGTLMFTLSSQNGEQTAGLSGEIAKKLTDMLFGSADPVRVNAVHAVIRKLAHVFVYAVFGAVLNLLAASFARFKNRLGVLISFMAAAVISVADEVHKIPISGRHCDFLDICLNILGGALGIILIAAVQKAIKHCGKQA